MDVGEVEFHPSLHLFESFGFAAPAVDLGPARDAGFHLVPEHVAANEFTVLLIMRHGVRSRANERHGSPQDVDELRQFIEGGAAQEGAEAGDARIVLLRLHDFCAVLLYMHGSKLPHLDPVATQAVTVLAKEDRTGRGQLDADGKHDHRDGDDQQEQAADNDVFQTFDDTVDPVERAFRDADHGEIADVAPACVQKIEHEEIRNHVNRNRGVRQFRKQLLDACFRAHRQRNVDNVYPAFVGVFDKGIEITDHLDRFV